MSDDGGEAGGYVTDPEQVNVILSATDPATGAIIAVCPNGHVHVVVGEQQAALTPEHAEEWVTRLYDAAQAARERLDDGGGDGGD